ncbi:hypothetical protein N7520_008426 [Penicillium odoratum]|uniref:uncharacterized protein n=1 Tax=Penicillium odoratum TaxID=1167516 RepID=UPI0025482FC8|nr:uncharacterized protein N7520_009749 [Penicillium odoratum]XP_056996366.1 uncharacterized protein N7520_008426 [Penicillium odoratum]KAJ5752832.1 hypothetical protein N7520_009749 [Penicillium odoratum]KAJ5761270.1 hypothetical protein N7520_008426 [Penicillium odoratum]
MDSLDKASRSALILASQLDNYISSSLADLPVPWVEDFDSVTLSRVRHVISRFGKVPSSRLPGCVDFPVDWPIDRSCLNQATKNFLRLSTPICPPDPPASDSEPSRPLGRPRNYARQSERQSDSSKRQEPERRLDSSVTTEPERHLDSPIASTSVSSPVPVSRPTTPQTEQAQSLPIAPSRSTVGFADFSPVRLPYTQVSLAEPESDLSCGTPSAAADPSASTEPLLTPRFFPGQLLPIPRMADNEHQSGRSDVQAMLTEIFTNPDFISLIRNPARGSPALDGLAPHDKPDTSWKPAEIGYFDPGLDDKDGGFTLVKNVMHYSNVFTFISRLNDLIRLKSERVVRANIHSCLKAEALAWYSQELTDNEKNMLQLVPLDDGWFKLLRDRFKPDRMTTLAKLDRCKYGWTQVREHRSARSHAQTMLTLLRSTGMTDPKDQICRIVMSIDATLARDLGRPSDKIEDFMRDLDFCYENWHRQSEESRNRVSTLPPRQATRPQFGYKSRLNTNTNQQWRQDLPLRTSTQTQYRPRYQQQQQQQQYPVSQQNYQAQYQTQYQTNPPQSQDSQSQISQPSRQVYTQYRPQPQRFGQAQAAPQAPRGQLLLTDKPHNPSQNDRQAYNRPRALLADANPGDEDEAQNQSRSPYVEDEPFDDSFESEPYQADDQYDLYDDGYDVPRDGPGDFPALACAPDEEVIVSCLQCDTAFPSNNQLHAHFESCRPKAAAPIDPVVNFAACSVPIISSSAQHTHDSGYAFRSWRYATATVGLMAPDQVVTSCLDSGCVMTLIDTKLAKSLDTTIQRISPPIPVSGIGSKHMSSDYITIDLYMLGQHATCGQAAAKLTIEAHLVDNLKAQLLIGMDIMGSEQISLDFKHRRAIIASCDDIAVPIGICAKPDHVENRPVYASKRTTILPKQSGRVPVKVKTTLPRDRDLIFDPQLPNAAKLQAFAQLVDSNITHVDVFNASADPVVISDRARIGFLSETDYTMAYQVHPEIAPLCLTGGPSPVDSRELIAPPNPPAGRHPGSTEVTLPNGVTAYGTTDEIQKIQGLVEGYDIWSRPGLVNLPQDQWMRLPLIPNAKLPRNQVYKVGTEAQATIDKVFDQLHDEGKMVWATNHAPSALPVFVVYKPVYDKDGKKTMAARPVIDARSLNKALQPDLYPAPNQDDIIQLALGKPFVSIIDAAKCYYQWRVHPDDVGLQAVITHRGQELLLVAIMGGMNSGAYVQRQMDNLFRACRHFMRTYTDDSFVAGMTFDEHLDQLRQVFDICQTANIRLDPKKARLCFPSLTLLGKEIDSVGITTDAHKLRAITSLSFPRTCKQLETYLGMTGDLRHFIPHYARIAEPLQLRKTALLKGSPVKGGPRRAWSNRSVIDRPSNAELEAFTALQNEFRKPKCLVHHDQSKQLYIDIDASKEGGFGAMVYHVEDDFQHDLAKPPPPPRIRPILFLSRLLTGAETRYWPTELEVACLVWTLRKTRHMVEAAPRHLPTVVYTDHKSTMVIATIDNLRSTSVENLNLRLVRASQYIQMFNLKIIYRPGVTNRIADALSRLQADHDSPPKDGEDLDSLTEGLIQDAFHAEASDPTGSADITPLSITSVCEVSDEFKRRIRLAYDGDVRWSSLIDVLHEDKALWLSTDKRDPTVSKLPYSIEDGLLFFTRASGERSLCLPRSMTGEIFQLVHDNQAHQGFDACWQKLDGITFYKGAKLLKQYITHCPVCIENKTRRHKPYGSLQPILSPPIPFHTLTMDWVVGLPTTAEGYDCALVMVCKFTKLSAALPGQTEWTGQQWAKVALAYWMSANWGIPSVMITDRDPKFVHGFWRAIFLALAVNMLYTAAHHSPTDGQSERAIQTFEMALRHWVAAHPQHIGDWHSALPAIQMAMNSSIKASTGYSPHQLLYGIKLRQPWNLLAKASEKDATQAARLDAEHSIAFASMEMKRRFDSAHRPIHFKVGDYVLLKLGDGYNIPANHRLPTKLGQRYVGRFRVLKRIGRLAYKLDLPSDWKIHPVISVAHLEPAPPGDDPWERPQTVAVDTHDPTFDARFPDEKELYDVQEILRKRTRLHPGRLPKSGIRGSSTEYLLRWAGCAELLKEFNERDRD